MRGSALLLLVFTAIPTRARAEEMGARGAPPDMPTGLAISEPSRSRVAILSTAEPRGLEVYEAYDDPEFAYPITRCVTPCDLRLTPARYKLRITESPGRSGAVRTLDVEADTRVQIFPDSRKDRALGLLFMLGGAALLGGGIALLATTPGRVDGDTPTGGQLLHFFGGAALVGAGVPVTLFGIVLLGRSGQPRVEVFPLAPAGGPRDARGPSPLIIGFRGSF